MLKSPIHCVCVVLWVLAAVVATAVGQKTAPPKKLPSVDKIVENYFKAIGGKKAVAARRDATYEWIIQLNDQPIGTARMVRKAPASERVELTFGNGQIISGTNPRSAWEIGLDKQLRTLTSLEAATAKLHTTLAASRLVDYKKANVLARVLSLGDLASEPAYIVEFSTRSGARVHYYFSVKSKLITKITSDAKKTRLVFEDYRPENGLLEPHRVRMMLPSSEQLPASSNRDGSGALTRSTEQAASGELSASINHDSPNATGSTEQAASAELSASTDRDSAKATGSSARADSQAHGATPAGSGELTLVLHSVKYDTGVDDQLFDPPGATEKLDVTSLLLEVARNQDETEKRVAEYSFKQTETDREINSKGELKKQTVKVYEVYPLPNREPVQKLISENGVPLSAERAAKEEKRVQEEFLKAERDKEKDEQEAAKRRAEREKKNAEREKKNAEREKRNNEENKGQAQKNDEDGGGVRKNDDGSGSAKKKNDEDSDPAISMFLRACDFVSPRRERFEGRESIVFDFRPRAGFKPKTREESLIAKLVGVVWIDPVDKQVIRLEARLAEGFKIAGGLVASLKPGAALVMEQTRMAQGVWLPRFAQINLSVKVLLFGGGDFNKTIEWSDYKHFSGDVKDYKIEAPATVRP